MIELASSTGKLTSVSGNAFSIAEILRNPRLPGKHKHSLTESYLDKLIERNVLNRYPPLLGHLLTLEVRAFINSLSKENRRKFEKVVKAFELDKENLKYFIGEIWSGGGVRVVAGTGAGMILTCITLLSGMKFHSYLGSSSGALQAVGRLLGATNSRLLEATIGCPFSSFYMDRARFEAWANELMRNAYLFYQDKEPSDDNQTIKGKHISETGARFDVMVGEPSKRGFPNNYLYPDKYYLLKELEERFGLNPDEFPIASALGATANLPGLFWYPFDPTFGNCSITSSNGKIHHLFDAGLDSKCRTPMDPSTEQVEKYKRTGEKPEIHLAIDYEPVTNAQIQKLIKQGGKYKKNKRTELAVKYFLKAIDIIDRSINDPPQERLQELGLQRTYINAPCAAINPFTKQIEVLETSSLSAPEETKQTVIFASIPTADFKDVDDSLIDQFYRKFVDEDFVNSEELVSPDGKVHRAGKSAYELILSDINYANGIPEIDNSSIPPHEKMPRRIWTLRQLADSTRAAGL